MVYKAFYFTLKPYNIENAEVLSALLDFNYFEGINEEGEILTGYIPADKLNDNALYEMKSVLSGCGCSLIWKIEEIAEQNWNKLWESNFEPVLIDTRCVVRAPFHGEYPDISYKITIEPKMSFGTGHHFTTRMMLEKILDTEVKGKKILDMGCGTGVLSILSSFCGAHTVIAVDNDKWAYENTIENIKTNKRDNIQVIFGGKESIPEQKFDLILANINRNILLDQIEDYSRLIVNNGLLIVSGILTEDIGMLCEQANKVGFNFESDKILNKWVLLTFRRN